MNGKYDIFRGTEKIGKAQITREGLYYRFRCYCHLTGEVIYRITASCGTKTENLGILIPHGDAFCLDRKLPASRFSSDALVLRAVPANPDKGSTFTPVYPDEPFRYIAKLNAARMERRDGVTGIVFRDDQSGVPLSSSSK